MNFLNLDEYESTMSTFMANLALTNPKLAEWAVRLAGKTLKSHYLEELSKSCSPGVAFRETHALASQMGVRLSLVVTEQTLNPRLYCMTARLENWLFNSYGSATDETVARFHLQGYHQVPALYAHGVYNLEYLLAMVRCWYAHPERQWIEG